jgi:hypothetical protein
MDSDHKRTTHTEFSPFNFQIVPTKMNLPDKDNNRSVSPFKAREVPKYKFFEVKHEG